MSRPVTTPAQIRYLATWPHGLPLGVPYGAADKPHVHDLRPNPAKDGRIYLVCKTCGYAIAQGGRGPVVKPKKS